MSFTEKRDLLEEERIQNENAVKVLAQLQTAFETASLKELLDWRP